MSHRGSLLFTPSGVSAIAATTPAESTPAMLAPLFAEPEGAVELALLGMGADIAAAPAALRDALRAHGLRFEAMATGAAARTYNVMVDEDRRVAAVLLAVP
ncbi:MAG: Mth938-like domain-containing protein [Rhodoblastus sp.]|nr:MAG: Mth938-like domain-containing protein [Rhodoblastus sp.]